MLGRSRIRGRPGRVERPEWLGDEELALKPRQAGLEGRPTPTLFALRDLRKDVDLAMALYGASATRTPLTRWSQEQIDAAAAAAPDLDISAVARLYRQAGPTADPTAARPVAPAA